MERGCYNRSILVSSHIVAASFISIICCLPSVGQQQRMVAITFDDLPVAETDIRAGEPIDPIEVKSMNQAILDSLRRHKVSATGFVIEKRVEDVGVMPGREILMEWAESGNDLGNHSYSHSDFNQSTIEQMEQEIVSGERSISEILPEGGSDTTLFSLSDEPYG